MTDIAKRLRSYLKSELDTSDDAARERDNMIEEAADEIERLRRIIIEQGAHWWPTNHPGADSSSTEKK